jgi:hypothetical protein
MQTFQTTSPKRFLAKEVSRVTRMSERQEEDRIRSLSMDTFEKLAGVLDSSSDFVSGFRALPQGLSPEEINRIGIYIGVAQQEHNAKESKIRQSEIGAIYGIGRLALLQGDLFTAGSAKTHLNQMPFLRARIFSTLLDRSMWKHANK